MGAKETDASKLEILAMWLLSVLVAMTQGDMRLPVSDQTRYYFLFLLSWTEKFLLLAFLPVFQKSFPLAYLLELLYLLLGQLSVQILVNVRFPPQFQDFIARLCITFLCHIGLSVLFTKVNLR